MIAVVWSDLWAQFAAWAGSLLLIGALAKTAPGKALIRNNATDPFREWLSDILKPTNDRIDGVNERLYELADTLEYEFKANSGNSLRDRVDVVARTVGAADSPPSDH